jgi:crotonobetainyl-CoA:carnitine CoA-transferase CaiB-like acyl-CoA transferase
MVSTCLNGQTGPHKDYPGFGSQGAALSGYNELTGFPDSDPITPFGTVTDSLGPRFTAAAIAAGLLYRQHTNKGIYFDLSQVEAATYALAPWLLDYAVNGTCISRMGNRSLECAPHGVFPCTSPDEPQQDKWIAIACWNNSEWETLRKLAQLDLDFPTLEERLQNQDVIEAAIAKWTTSQNNLELANQLQKAGIEAVPLFSFEEQFENEPQLTFRKHFTKLERDITGTFYYERNGFRCELTPDVTYRAPTPLLGEHTENILQQALGMNDIDIETLKQQGGIE